MNRSFTQVLWSRRWLVLLVLVVALVASPILKKFAEPTYSATAQIAYIGNSTNSVILPADLPELALSTKVIKGAIDVGRLNLEPGQVLARATVRQSPHSNVIPVGFRSKDRALAISVANAIVDATVSEYKSLSTRQYDQVIAKLASQAQELRAQIASFDTRYHASVQGDPMAGVTTGLDALVTRLDGVDQSIAQARARLASDRAAARVGSSSGAAGFNDVIREETLAHDPSFSALLGAQAKDQADYATARAGYTDAFPGLPGLEEKVVLEKAAASREAASAAALHRGASPTYAQTLVAARAAQSLVAGDQAQIDALTQNYATLRARVNELPNLTRSANDFRVQRDASTIAYTQVVSRLNAALGDKAAAASLNSIVVLNRATGAEPNFPRGVADILIALLILGLAIGAAYLAELLDPRIRTQADVESLYGTPLIGTL